MTARAVADGQSRRADGQTCRAESRTRVPSCKCADTRNRASVGAGTPRLARPRPERHPRANEDLVENDLWIVAQHHPHTLKDEKLPRREEAVERLAAIPFRDERQQLAVAGIRHETTRQTARICVHPAD